MSMETISFFLTQLSMATSTTRVRYLYQLKTIPHFPQLSDLTAHIEECKVRYVILKCDCIAGSLFQRFEVNIGSEAKKWQVFPFRQFMDERNNQRMIFAGNVIRLKHAESGGYICLDDEGKIPNT